MMEWVPPALQTSFLHRSSQIFNCLKDFLLDIPFVPPLKVHFYELMISLDSKYSTQVFFLLARTLFPRNICIMNFPPWGKQYLYFPFVQMKPADFKLIFWILWKAGLSDSFFSDSFEVSPSKAEAKSDSEDKVGSSCFTGREVFFTQGFPLLLLVFFPQLMS